MTGDVVEKPILFLHVPKCGGSSVRKALEETIGLKNDPQVSILGNTSRRGSIKIRSNSSRKSSMQMGIDLHDHREHILMYMLNESPNIISGHFRYSNKMYKKYKEKYYFVTIIRNAIDRWFSQYFYNKKRDSISPIEKEIQEFIKTERAKKFGTILVKYFTENRYGKDLYSSEVIEEAINNLKKFDVAGTIERKKEFEKKFTEKTGVSINIPHVNKGKKRSMKEERIINEEVKRKVEKIVAPDMKVYRYTVKNIV